MTASSELQEIRELLQVISRRLDLLIENRETEGVMRLAEESLGGFLEGEPDLYSDSDLGVEYVFRAVSPNGII